MNIKCNIYNKNFNLLQIFTSYTQRKLLQDEETFDKLRAYKVEQLRLPR
jgi:hypothetical protein